MDAISNAFGYILNAIYNLEFVQNYGLALILFTILIKVVLLPISIKQQKTLKKTTVIQGEVKKIQEKYKGDQEKINKETMELYKRENMNPFSGCLSSIVQIVLLFAIFFLVSKPLTHMKQLDSNLINGYANEIKTGQVVVNKEQVQVIDGEEVVPEENKINTQNVNTQYPEIAVIRVFGAYDEKVNINMNFFGIDLSKVPSESTNDIKVYIIPVLYIISSLITLKMTNLNTKKKEEKASDEKALKEGEEQDVDVGAQVNKNMMYMMPIMSVIIAMVAPLGLALYWLVNNVLTIIERVFVNKYLKSKEEIKNV
ncbi:MAG: YidC/Oxa1 family membrane protein insertase [Lachnospiraceae bacterium]|jgi:YidC/Oxa1 family membrane protein insertase|nr:YidC/Oxa1 family membrane protein insertase [Lachnospiraceae bacterium]